jgi:Flp pilus assembly pilin Flp
VNLDKVFTLGAAIVAVAMVTTIVSHPTSAQVIRAVGDAFTSSLRAAMGK